MTGVVVAVEDKAVAGVDRSKDFIGAIVVESPASVAPISYGETRFDGCNVHRLLCPDMDCGSKTADNEYDQSDTFHDFPLVAVNSKECDGSVYLNGSLASCC